MGSSFGRAEQEGNHVGDVLGSRRSMRPTGSPGKTWGRGDWESRSEWGPEAPPPLQPQSDSSLASESFLSASHSC